MAEIGTLLGLIYCLYSVLFRFQSITNRYGSLDLLFWVSAVVFWSGLSFALVGAFSK